MTYQIAYMTKRGAGRVDFVSTLDAVAKKLAWLCARQLCAIARDQDGQTVGNCDDGGDHENPWIWWCER